uniref:Uncharacterized protein n=1 Tax=Meloidogyne enterolobii TaxID=390850 RepID=A0A6V7X2L6_MELEN|nr:unnamed protein product [Meloidogyne enterolobii]
MKQINQIKKYIPNELIVDIFKATNRTNTTKIQRLEDKIKNQTAMNDIKGITKTTKQIYETWCVYAINCLKSSSIAYIYFQNLKEIKASN